MDEGAIRDRYLDLFSIRWDTPELVKPLEELREQVEEAGLDTWVRLIDARLKRNGKHFEEALRELEPILETTPDDPHALWLKAALLSENADRRLEAFQIYERIVGGLSANDDLVSQQVVAMAMGNKGFNLNKMNKPQEALDACDEVIRRFGDCPETPLRENVAKALLNKGVALLQIDNPQEALAANDELIRRFGDCPETSLPVEVAMALFNKGFVLVTIHKPKEAVAAFDELIHRFGDCPETPLREVVARALVNKGIRLGQMDRPQEALAIYDEVISRFAGDESEKIGLHVSLAKRGKALLAKKTAPPEQAKEAEDAALQSTEGRYSETLQVYHELLPEGFQEDTVEEYFAQMSARTERTDEFLKTASRFRDDASLLLVLREWNSYTPAIPGEQETDRGGGYFIRHAGAGIVVDPGYDFIQNFHRAGGVLADIDHIILTHAHDDHTAELEALLMLLHQRAQYVKEGSKPARVQLYLSEGAQRKFAGLISLKDDSQIASVTTLNRQQPGSLQRIRLSEQITLTVLPAYHDDVLSRDTAVGLGFEFALPHGKLRRVAFTGDSGYYPRKLNTDGKQEYYDYPTNERPKVDCSEQLGLIAQYPEEFRHPDLLVAHIGSINEEEFKPLSESLILSTSDGGGLREEGEWYYVNHLGLLGALTLLDKSSPRKAIISEFGAELKDFNIELVVNLGGTLNKKQRRDHEKQQGDGETEAPQSFVIPGDITIVYDIAEDRFLCHEDGQVHRSEDLQCVRHDTYDVSGENRNLEPDKVERNKDIKRAHLFLKNTQDGTRDAGIAKYYRDLFAWNLPHLKPPD